MGIENCVVINLRRRQDRLVAVSKQLKALGLRWERFEAVDGHAISYAQLAMLAESARNEYLASSPGQRARICQGMVGCVSSHRQVIQMAMDRDWDSVFVLEDDAVFHPRFWWLFTPPPYGFRLARLGSVVPPKRYTHVEGIWHTTKGKVDCTSGYIATKAVYEELLDRWDGTYPADWGWSKTKKKWGPRQFKEIDRAYIANPFLVGMADGWSDVSWSQSRYGIQQRMKREWV